MRPFPVWLGATFLAAAPAAPLSAHHSAAAYDLRATIRIDGRVTQFDWGNPHVYLEVEEQASDASPGRRWVVELAHPGTVSRLGLDRSSLEIGDEVSVLANPARDQRRTLASLISLTAAGESLIDMREIGSVFGALLGSTDGQSADSIEGIWGPSPEAWMQSGLADPEVLPLSDAARQAAENFDPRSMTPGMDCLPEPLPAGMIAASAPTVFSIDLAEDRVTIRGEADGMVRTIRLDRTSHVAGTPSPYGHSIGRWDGDTLVVDTVGFEPHPQGIAPRVPSGDGKHLVERFALDSDGERLLYSYELSDPEYLTDVITGSVEWLYVPGIGFDPVPCTLASAQRFRSE